MSVLVDVVLVVDSSVAGAVVDALVDVLIGGTLVSSGESFSPFMDRERLNSADTSSISFVFSASVIALDFAAEELLLTTALSEESAAITGRGSPLDAVIFLLCSSRSSSSSRKFGLLTPLSRSIQLL